MLTFPAPAPQAHLLPSTLPRRPLAVICDMDGLLLDSERHIRAAYLREFAERGRPMTDSEYSFVIGRNSRDLKSYFTRHCGFGFPVTEVMDSVHSAWRRRCLTEGVPLKAGVHELLNTLDQLKLPRALATSTSRPSALKSLAQAGLDVRFYAIITGEEIVRGKPAPDIYLEAARRLGVAPRDCLALEDSEAGAIAADSAGMQLIIVPDLKRPGTEVTQRAVAVVESLYAVVNLLLESV